MRTALRTAYLVAGLAGVGFFAMSVLLLGVWPAAVLEREIAEMGPGGSLPLTASEQLGREIYAREGCAYCHTQQVRYVNNDVERFGAATLAWETTYDYPHLWGTRRIGPDLARESGVRREDWQLAHLYDPRAIVPASVMPAFPHLFEGAPDRPTQEGRQLLAYLETLGRARLLAAPEGEEKALKACHDCSPLGFMSLDVHPSKARRVGETPVLTGGDLARGRYIYDLHCASCHGGTGDGSGGAGLLPRPSNFREKEYKLERLSFALWNGVAGTAMPAWRDLPVSDLASVALVVQGFSEPQAEIRVAGETIALGERVYREHCLQCHGVTGAGDGYAVDRFEMSPPDMRYVRPALEDALVDARGGIAGTPMGAWSEKLSDDEVSAAVYYMRGFFQP